MSSPLDGARELVAGELAVAKELFERSLASRVASLDLLGRHLVESGGKGLRAVLCVLAGKAVGVAPEEAQTVAAAAELTHAASLCHDDVLDRADVRRGRPSVRARFGDAAAILLGDLCVAGAFGVLAAAGLGRTGERLADVVREMAEGEVLQDERARQGDATLEDQLEIAEAKTGALLAWCATVGEIVPLPFRAALNAYGRAVGRAYQVADDVLDLEVRAGPDASPGHDLRRGTVTVPVLLACSTRPDLRKLVASAGDRAATASLVEAIRGTGAIDRARELARQESERAQIALQLLPPSRFRRAMEELARFAAERSD